MLRLLPIATLTLGEVRRLLAVVMISISASITLSGCGVFFAIDECDPSENMELSDMTTEELDALCGKDRSFKMGHES